MQDQLVSVVMPVYNAAATVRAAVESVLAQTHVSLELLAVDDGSSDDSWRMLERFAEADARVRALRMPVNGGVAAARNLALDTAVGQYVAFLDSDDGWLPRKLELQIAQMRASGAQVSYCAYDRVAEDGRLLSRVRPPDRVSYADMLKSNRIGNLTGMYERSLGDVHFQRIGHEDYVFWLDRVRRAGHAIRVGDGEPLAWYLVRGGSVSSNKWKAARWQWRIYRDVEHLGPLAAARYMLHYALNALRKRA